jgi:hypothetical protein
MRYELTDRDWFAEHLDLREIVTPGLGELLRASLFAAFGHSSPPPERASLLSRCKDAAAASMFPPVGPTAKYSKPQIPVSPAFE